MLIDPHFHDVKIAGWWVWGISLWIGAGWCSTGKRLSRQIPMLSGAGNGIHSLSLRGWDLRDRLHELSQRLRYVRVACGDWSRVLTPAVTTYIGDTGVFLDPPYAGEEDVYGACASISGDVREWAILNGSSPRLRIALCGYEGEHEMPDGWTSVAWKAVGGYGNQGDGEGRINANRERIWFSPHCLSPCNGQAQSLFESDQW